MKYYAVKNTFLKSLLLIMILLASQNYLKASISIDSVKTTISRCPNNGTITVFASSSETGILYSILSGPEIRPYQSNNLFNGLLPGIYVVAVTNTVGELDTQSVIIKGSNYVEPDFAPTSKEPTCFGGSDGQIIGHPILNNSRRPFTWVLTNTNTGVVTTQSNDTFNNLKASTYTLRMYDSCQNFVTKTVYINNTETIFSFKGIDIAKTGCDSFSVSISFYSKKTSYTSPVRLTIYLNNDSIIQSILPAYSSIIAGYTVFKVNSIIPGLTYGSTFKFILEDNTCDNKIISDTIKTPAYIFSIRTFYPTTGNCKTNLGAILDLHDNIFRPSGFWLIVPKFPLTMTVKDIDSNKIVQTSTINYGLLDITPKTGGRNYLISITDGCGETYSFDTIWPTYNNQPKVIRTNYYSCLDSVASLVFKFEGFNSMVNMEFTAGPKILHSTKPKYTYFDSITYPKTFHNISSQLFIKNFPVGKYYFKATDSCNNMVLDSFEVTIDDIGVLNHSTSYTKGCIGENKLYIEANTLNSAISSILIINLDNNSWAYNYFGNINRISDSVTSIPPGKYKILINYIYVNSKNINDNIIPCAIVNDTLEIPPYERPNIEKISTFYCNGNRYAELHPDSTKGIAPYKYEVISGPKLYPLQSSNVFTFIPVGNYVSRIVDACGNSNILNFGVDTLIFPPINKIGSSCLNGNVILFYQPSPFYTYQWIKPDGSIYVIDTLKINNVVYADTGVYQIKRFVNINGCKDTAETSYRLTSTAEYTRSATICEGESINIGAHIYTQSGNYMDTIPSLNCDTIYHLNLTVLPIYRKVIDTTICFGRSIKMGTIFYDKTGTYLDTFKSKNGCDSFVTLKLTIVQGINLNITATKTIVLPGDTVQLTSISNQPIRTYNWTSIATLNNASIPNPIVTITQPSWVYLNVTGDSLLRGCKNRDSIFIDIINDCKTENVFIPNSFTPNGDGNNDVFRVRSNTLQSGKLVVYNRWGNKVFESDDLTKGWDGIYKGQIDQEDAYGYYFEGFCINGEIIKLKGNVTLLK